MGVTGAIAAVLCLGLFLVQLISAVLRREPGGLGRAVTGLVVSFIGSTVALGVTRALLGAVDTLSDGLVSYTLGTNISGLGSKLAIAQLLPDLEQLVDVVGRLHRARFHGVDVEVAPLPHPSGASTWHRTEPGKTLLAQGLAAIAGHDAFAGLLDRAT
jgi:hypothetical protein